MDRSTFGSFGLRPEDVTRTEFYSFFYLAEKRRKTTDDGSLVVRHGTSYQFARFVFFDVVADRSGFTKGLALGIARSFIDDPETGSFARDYAKSFLGTATASEEDRATLAPFVDDLHRRALPSRSRLDRSQTDPDTLLEAVMRVSDLGHQAVVALAGRVTARSDARCAGSPTDRRPRRHRSGRAALACR